MALASLSSGQRWPDCDADLHAYVDATVDLLVRVLGPELVGVYLHGSLAMGCYHRPKSDLDVIVVSANRVDPELRRSLAVALAHHAAARPTVGSLELSVITADVAWTVPVPTPFELHYSETWHDQILGGTVDYTADRDDPDLPSHLTYVVQRGLTLHGPEIAEAFGSVPWPAFWESVLDDTRWILTDDHVLETPVYAVLNLCRVLQLAASGDQRAFSKDEGAQWALTRISVEHRGLVARVLDAYRSSAPVTPDTRTTAGLEWDTAALLSFRDHAREQLTHLL